MDISRYAAFFHDGSIINIKQDSFDKIEISMESNQVLPDWNVDNLELSSFQTIKGILHIRQIESIMVNDTPTKHLQMTYDDGEIARFRIQNNNVRLNLLWSNYPPKKRESRFDCIVINAKNIDWENIPNLFNPMD